VQYLERSKVTKQTTPETTGIRNVLKYGSIIKLLRY